MPSRHSFRVLSFLAATGIAAAALAAGPTAQSFSRDFDARLDGAPSAVATADGRIWSAWSYRASGELDLAIAVRGADGRWGATTFIGRRDGIDQIDPTVAIDARGTVYVAYASRAPQRVLMVTLPADAPVWSEPAVVSLDGTVPALRIVADRLVVAFRVRGGVRLADFPLYVPPINPDGIQDGPDGVDPLGNGVSELPSSGGTGSGSTPPPPPPPDGEGESSN